jgi:hypothetical protein
MRYGAPMHRPIPRCRLQTCQRAAAWSMRRRPPTVVRRHRSIRILLRLPASGRTAREPGDMRLHGKGCAALSGGSSPDLRTPMWIISAGRTAPNSGGSLPRNPARPLRRPGRLAVGDVPAEKVRPCHWNAMPSGSRHLRNLHWPGQPHLRRHTLNCRSGRSAQLYPSCTTPVGATAHGLPTRRVPHPPSEWRGSNGAWAGGRAHHHLCMGPAGWVGPDAT